MGPKKKGGKKGKKKKGGAGDPSLTPIENNCMLNTIKESLSI